MAPRRLKARLRRECFGLSCSSTDSWASISDAHSQYEMRSKRTISRTLPSNNLFSFDLDYPILCDDEYLDTGNPETEFKQPPDQPAHIIAFVHHLRLVNIVSIVMKTIYGTKKSKQAAGCKGGDNDNTVSLIDSMLSSWFDAIPEHCSCSLS